MFAMDQRGGYFKQKMMFLAVKNVQDGKITVRMPPWGKCQLQRRAPRRDPLVSQQQKNGELNNGARGLHHLHHLQRGQISPSLTRTRMGRRARKVSAYLTATLFLVYVIMTTNDTKYSTVIDQVRDRDSGLCWLRWPVIMLLGTSTSLSDI